jgi:hypothetical protein
MNLEKEVKRKVNQVLKLRRQLFVLDVISKSRFSVNENCKEFDGLC